MPNFPDSHRDLLDAQVASFATIDDRGFPQVTAVWFLFDGEKLRLSLSTDRRKTQNLRARPECSLFILDPANAFRYLEVRGRARLEADDGYVFADQVGNKYGADLRAYDSPETSRVAVTIEPVAIHAVTIGA